MSTSTHASSDVAVPEFADAHTHLLKESAGIPFPWRDSGVSEFHQMVARSHSTPMDVLESPAPAPVPVLSARIRSGLARAAAAGLVEITEMGMRAWWYLDALAELEREALLPLRIRIYLASGLAEEASLAEIDARRSSANSWVRLDGVKFYADGWLGPRTCATCRGFHDQSGNGLLFMTAEQLARRIEPFADHGWRIATHAIGDRGIATVLDAYDMVWGSSVAELFEAAPRIEHASLLSADLISRIAECGVVACIQPSFAMSDVQDVAQALDSDLQNSAYPWVALAASGARVVAGHWIIRSK